MNFPHFYFISLCPLLSGELSLSTYFPGSSIVVERGRQESNFFFYYLDDEEESSHADKVTEGNPATDSDRCPIKRVGTVRRATDTTDEDIVRINRE